LTRGPIIFAKCFHRKMDCRVKPGNDGRKLLAFLLGAVERLGDTFERELIG
jgi:hypothetical protein